MNAKESALPWRDWIGPSGVVAVPKYRRILTIIDATDTSGHVVARAALLGKMLGATIALATISDEKPRADQTVQARFASISAATTRAESLAGKAGLGDLEVLVSERDPHALAAVVASWSPDLLVLGPTAPGGLVGWRDGLRILTMAPPGKQGQVLIVAGCAGTGRSGASSCPAMAMASEGDCHAIVQCA